MLDNQRLMDEGSLDQAVGWVKKALEETPRCRTKYPMEAIQE